MENYFGEIDQLVIRLNVNGVDEESYIGPAETEYNYKKKIGDVTFTLYGDNEINFDFEALSENQFQENFYYFVSTYGRELKSMMTLWRFANYFEERDDDTGELFQDLTNDYTWEAGSSFLGENISDEQKFENAEKLIEDCLLLGDDLDFAHIVATVS